MPQALTYPGVYIEEIPSGVHTIVGVGTSIAAFVGYTASGPDNEAVQLFSWSDYIRNFGPLTSDSELSYGVQQFFANGGRTCFVVRIPKSDAVAGVLNIGDSSTPPAVALTLNAISSGAWSQRLTAEVDYDGIASAKLSQPGTAALTNNQLTVTLQNVAAASVDKWVTFDADPAKIPYKITGIAGNVITLNSNYTGPSNPNSGWVQLVGYDQTAFNLTIADTISGKTEKFANLSMLSTNTNFVKTIINDHDNGSEWVRISTVGPKTPQVSGLVATPPGDNVLAIKPGLSELDTWLSSTSAKPQINSSLSIYLKISGVDKPKIDLGELWSNQAAMPTTAAALIRTFSIAATNKLQAQYPGAQVTTKVVTTGPGKPANSLQIKVSIPDNYDTILSFDPPPPAPGGGGAAPPAGGGAAPPAGGGAAPPAGGGAAPPAGGGAAPPAGGGAAPPAGGGAAPPAPTADLASILGLKSQPGSVGPILNVGAYYFGHAAGLAGSQLTGTTPADGTNLPTSAEIVGSPTNLGPGGTTAPTGIYALDDVDLFNILCIPDATRAKSGSPSTQDFLDDQINAIYSAAMTYCRRRRAFLIIDSPPNANDVASAQNWRSRRLTVNDANGAVYFPRLLIADPLDQNNLRAFAPGGTIAGMFANEDANRGVWKAPAGIETNLAGVQKLTYNLKDNKQGVLNPIALNCVRTFPIYGSVIWGARTLVGADEQASEWKYIPVRRTALFIEESLYRGTKWVVFEPNDEPLWAQLG